MRILTRYAFCSGVAAVSFGPQTASLDYLKKPHVSEAHGERLRVDSVRDIAPGESRCRWGQFGPDAASSNTGANKPAPDEGHGSTTRDRSQPRREPFGKASFERLAYLSGTGVPGDFLLAGQIAAQCPAPARFEIEEQQKRLASDGEAFLSY